MILATATAASAEPSLQEYVNRTLRAPSQLSLGDCGVVVQFHGAIVDVELHQAIKNSGTADLGASYELALPSSAEVIGAAVRDDGHVAPAINVATGAPVEPMDSTKVLGADPLLVTQVGTQDAMTRYRAILQPLAIQHEVTIALRWTDVADIRDGMLHYALPGGLGSRSCVGRVIGEVGPGARVQEARVGGKRLDGSTFMLGSDDLPIDLVLAIAGDQPIAWLQDNVVDGHTARAVTVIAPPQRTTAPPDHVVFVIDTSRSMDLVGRPAVRKVVKAIAAALPKPTVVEAIVFDRTASRVLGAWRPAAEAAPAIDQALAVRGSQPGSDLVAALRVAHGLVTGKTMVVAITDGVLGKVAGDDLTRALDARIDELDVHAIVLDPPRMPSPGVETLRVPIGHYGGSYAELSVDNLDAALADVASWLRPSWVEIVAEGDLFHEPDQVRAGGGFVAFGTSSRLEAVTIRGRNVKPFKITPRTGPKAPIGMYAVGTTRDLVVLSTVGRVARSRQQMIAGGGPFTRVVALPDPVFEPMVSIGTATAPLHSAIDRGTVKRLLADQLQPRSYACYQRALALDSKLAGTIQLDIDLGRGEVTHVELAGTGNTAFDACVLDAAYAMTPPMPTPGVNDDDRTVATYAMSFVIRDAKPLVLPGDADSSAPIDIEAVKGGVPRRLNVDVRTPLGGLTPPAGP